MVITYWDPLTINSAAEQTQSIWSIISVGLQQQRGMRSNSPGIDCYGYELQDSLPGPNSYSSGLELLLFLVISMLASVYWRDTPGLINTCAGALEVRCERNSDSVALAEFESRSKDGNLLMNNN
jgi:hypothetical protein